MVIGPDALVEEAEGFIRDYPEKIQCYALVLIGTARLNGTALSRIVSPPSDEDLLTTWTAMTEHLFTRIKPEAVRAALDEVEELASSQPSLLGLTEDGGMN